MKNLYITRKERIILSTIDLINEIGIKELSVKEIANREKITEAALYKHFESKEQILIEVVEYYSKYDNNIIRTINNNSNDGKEKILKFFQLYSEYYDSYPAITAIIGFYNVLLYENNIAPKLKEIFYKRADFLKVLIEEGQNKGDIKSEIKSENLRDILLGSFERTIFIWRLNKFKFSLKEKTIEIISDILKVC